MKPIEVGFDGSFNITSGGWYRSIKVRLTRTAYSPKDWKEPPIDNTFVWLYTDPDNPQLLYKNKEGKLYSVNFEPFGQ
jgi:hypothetical protein